MLTKTVCLLKSLWLTRLISFISIFTLVVVLEVLFALHITTNRFLPLLSSPSSITSLLPLEALSRKCNFYCNKYCLLIWIFKWPIEHETRRWRISAMKTAIMKIMLIKLYQIKWLLFNVYLRFIYRKTSLDIACKIVINIHSKERPLYFSPPILVFVMKKTCKWLNICFLNMNYAV